MDLLFAVLLLLNTLQLLRAAAPAPNPWKRDARVARIDQPGLLRPPPCPATPSRAAPSSGPDVAARLSLPGPPLFSPAAVPRAAPPIGPTGTALSRPDGDGRGAPRRRGRRGGVQ